MNSRYGLIPSLSEKQMNYFSYNLAIKDTSNNLLERNMFMMNSKAFKSQKRIFLEFELYSKVIKKETITLILYLLFK